MDNGLLLVMDAAGLDGFNFQESLRASSNANATGEYSRNSKEPTKL